MNLQSPKEFPGMLKRIKNCKTKSKNKSKEDFRHFISIKNKKRGMKYAE